MLSLYLYPLIIFLETHENKLARSKALCIEKVFMNVAKNLMRKVITLIDFVRPAVYKCADFPKPIHILEYYCLFLKYSLFKYDFELQRSF